MGRRQRCPPALHGKTPTQGWLLARPSVQCHPCGDLVTAKAGSGLANSWRRNEPQSLQLKERVKLFLESQWVFTWKNKKHQGDAWRPPTSRSKYKVGLKRSPIVQNKIVPILNLPPRISHAGKTSRMLGLLLKLKRTSEQHNRSVGNTHLCS